MDKNVHYLKWDSFANVLKGKKMAVFTLLDLKRIFLLKEDTLKRFLSRQTKKNKLIRLKRGLYCLKDEVPNELVIAGRLYLPSYISLEFALSYYSIIPETVYAITSVTPKTTREFIVSGKSYTFNKIKKEAYCDYTIQKKDDSSFFIATPEKALADYLYFISLGLRSKNERIVWTKVNLVQVKKLLINKFGLKSKYLTKLLL